MKIDCSAGMGVMPSEECLICSQNNPTCGFDYCILKSMYGDEETERRKNEIHVSDITGCLRRAYMTKTCPTPERPHEILARWLGTSTHSFIEDDHDMAQSEMPVEWEGLMGKVDLLYNDGRLLDLKCQPAGELVTMADGTEKKIEEIKIFDSLLSWNGNEFTPAKVTSIMDGGVQDVYEVTLLSKQKIRVSGNHPLLSDNGWKVAKELIVGSEKLIVLEDWQGSVNIDAGDARLLGYLTGDGSCSHKYGIAITNPDVELIEDMAEICKSKEWELHPIRYGHDTAYTNRITNFGKKQSATGPMSFIKQHGLHGKHSYDKTVPEDVMKGNKETIVNFLAGYFDTDGTITDPKGTIPSRLSITTTSKPLAYQVAELLRRLGIGSIIQSHATSYVKNGTRTGCRQAYVVNIWQSEQMARFIEEIPFRRSKLMGRAAGWQPILERKLNKGTRDTRLVQSVVNLGPMQTIGLEIEGTHCYISNGIVTHNTTRWLYPSKIPYGSHALQVNIYAWMLKKNGIAVNRMQIQYIDMSGPTKCRACKVPVQMVDGILSCPSCHKEIGNAHLGAVLVEIPFMDDEVIEQYTITKKNELKAALDLGMMPAAEPGYLCSYCSSRAVCQPEVMEVTE